MSKEKAPSKGVPKSLVENVAKSRGWGRCSRDQIKELTKSKQVFKIKKGFGL